MVICLRHISNSLFGQFWWKRSYQDSHRETCSSRVRSNFPLHSSLTGLPFMMCSSTILFASQGVSRPYQSPVGYTMQVAVFDVHHLEESRRSKGSLPAYL